jgi:hypothetical protein
MFPHLNISGQPHRGIPMISQTKAIDQLSGDVDYEIAFAATHCFIKNFPDQLRAEAFEVRPHAAASID